MRWDRSTVGMVVFVSAVALMLSGCDEGPSMGEVSGTVTIDGNPPPRGSSISFGAVDGKSPTAGALLNDDGTYTVLVPIGLSKVEIRAPRPMRRRGAVREGPGAESPESGDLIEEMLPAKFNNASELTFDVKEGENPKNWELFTK